MADRLLRGGITQAVKLFVALLEEMSERIPEHAILLEPAEVEGEIRHQLQLIFRVLRVDEIVRIRNLGFHSPVVVSGAASHSQAYKAYPP